MPEERPSFVPPDAPWESVQMRFNGLAIILYRTKIPKDNIHGWVNNPRIEMILGRWRKQRHRSQDAFPTDEEMLELMLEDDSLNPKNQTFAIQELGEDIKRNLIRDPIIVTWQSKLLDGNRRKFAHMWALSERGGATPEQRILLDKIPTLVLHREAGEAEEKAILIQENYADSLKKAWPEVVANRKLYDRYRELSDVFTSEDDLQIRRHLHEEFPRFGVTEIRDRIETWQLTEEFRVEYSEELDDDELDRLINDQFQYFRQARDTFRAKAFYQNPDFKQLLFKGIMHKLFPSFAAVRDLEDIFNSQRASEIFLQGEGMSGGQKKQNFRRARDEAGRERAEKEMSAELRLTQFIDFLDNLTSTQIANLSSHIVDRLRESLNRLIAQAQASPGCVNSDG